VLGVLIVVALIVVAIALGWAIVQLIALPFGGIGTGVSFFWAFLLVCVVVGVLIFVGRRRQAKARAKMAEQRAAQFRR
jgi:hypothetical protein